LLQHHNFTADDTAIYMGCTEVKIPLSSPVLAVSIHIHPKYNNPNGLNYNNDIALIKLRDTIIFNSTVMPICLPAIDATYVTGMIGLVSGFTIRENDNQQTFTNKLKYVHLLVVKQKKCTKSVKKMRTGNLPSVTNNMFCVGVPEGGKDSCHGDSGSPLALKDNRRQFWAAGIVSWVVDFFPFELLTSYLTSEQRWVEKWTSRTGG
uniref:trypsin n=1 Tax=Mola mola TaxID=94237 RepID=A0A3Q3X6L6_MOLML